MKFICSYCGKKGEKSTGHYNSAMQTSPNLYCNRKCVGLSKRKTVEEKKRLKSEYDKRLRQDYVYGEKKMKQQHEWFKKDYAANPDKYRKWRKEKYKKHLEYLSTPEYKAWKKDYDEKYLAKKQYGAFAEAALILKNIENELESKLIKYANNVTQNKSTQKRKRQWQTLQRTLRKQKQT